MRYYAENLEEPLTTAYIVLGLIEVCQTRFGPDCAETSQKFGDAAALKSAFDLGSLFSGSLGSVKVPATATFEALINAITNYRTRLRREVRTYDMALLPRILAVFNVCPPPEVDAKIRKLEVMATANFRRLENQSAEDFAKTLDQINREARLAEQRIRAEWPPATCAKASELGVVMMNVLIDKVRPYTGNDWRQETENRKFARVTGYILDAATQVAGQHDPVFEKRMRALEPP